jgi:hypothetical protein
MDRRATRLDELWGQIQQAWDELDIGKVNRLVDSMRKGDEMLLQLGGTTPDYERSIYLAIDDKTLPYRYVQKNGCISKIEHFGTKFTT